MRTPRSRRALLVSAVSLSATVAGCFEGRFTGSDDTLNSGVVPADTYDCADVERPEPDTPTRDLALEPAEYPDRPESLLQGIVEYVREFETVYRRNEFISSYKSETETFDFRFEEAQTNEVESESDRDAVLVAIVYTLSKTTRGNDWPPERYTLVTYYVDENVMLRAHYGGPVNGPAFDPNPRTSGDPVACFE